MRQERFDVRASEGDGMLIVVEVDVSDDPAHVLLFGAVTVVPLVDFGPDMVEQARFRSMLHNQPAAFDDNPPPWSI